MLLLLLILPGLSFYTLLHQRHHLLMALLSLEATVLILTTLSVAMSPTNFPLALTILSLGACEASIGLALMVSMSRQYGNDLLFSLSLNKW